MSGVRDIVGIKIQGANFRTDTLLDIFSGNGRMALIYGENGAGKSTIAKGIDAYKNHLDNDGIQITFLDNKKNEIQIDNADRRVFVFDEDYIQNMVGMKSDSGLDTIVILGELKNVDEQINIWNEKLKEERRKYESEKEKLVQMESIDNPQSEQSLKMHVLDILRDDNGWADRLRQIRGNKTKAKVDDKCISRISAKQDLLYNVPENIKDDGLKRTSWIEKYVSEKRNKLNQDIKFYENTSNANGFITEKIQVGKNTFHELECINILAQVVEEPEITKRDAMIIAFEATIQAKGMNFINNVKEDFEKIDLNACPYCQQKVDVDRKRNLVKAISKVLEAQVNVFLDKLSDFKIIQSQYFPMVNWEIFAPLNDFELVENCKSALMALSDRITYINTILQEKMNNPYKAICITIQDIGFKTAYSRALKLSTLLNESVDRYNKAVVEHNSMRKSLENLNDEIAFWEIYELSLSMNQARISTERQQKNVIEIDSRIKNIEAEINRLKEKKKQVKIAVDEINSSLAYIFLSSERLKIEYNSLSNDYKVKVNNMDVKPSDVSLGERNAIALSYFFSDIKKNQNLKNFYKKDCLLVIDDPISSFDRENRIGVVSFLRRELLKFIKENMNTKILIMTHDMQVLFDLEKMSKSISECLEENNKLKVKCYRLKNGKMHNLPTNYYQEYTILLTQIYKFAIDMDENNIELQIGNMMRRVLEAYGTFTYREGGSRLFNNEDILEKIPNKRREFFKNFMIRLFLNSDSHFEESVRAFNDMNFFSIMSLEDKQKFAQYVLCFLYSLDSVHILAHLQDGLKQKSALSIKERFKSWLNYIDSLII